MPEQFKPYTSEEAWNEAELMKDKMTENENLSYTSAGKEIELEKAQNKQECLAKFGENFNKPQGFNCEEIAKMIVGSGEEEVANNIKKNDHLNNDVAVKLIDAGYAFQVSENLDKFSSLDNDVAFKLIKAGRGYAVARTINKFSSTDHEKIAKKLFEDPGGKVSGKGILYVFENLDKFHGLDYMEVALKLIDAGFGELLMKNPEKISNIDYNKLASKLCEVSGFRSGKGYLIINHIAKFENLSLEVALKLLEENASNGAWICWNINKFENNCHREIALKIIGLRDTYSVSEMVRKLNKFHGINHQEIASALFETGLGDCIVENLEKFKGLDHTEIVLRLIQSGHSYCVEKDFQKFQTLDKQVVPMLIKAGKGECVAENIEKFHDLDHMEIAIKLIESGHGGLLAKKLEKFKGANHTEIALKLLQTGLNDDVEENFENFQGLDYEKIAIYLLNCKNYSIIYNNADKFSNIQPEAVLNQCHGIKEIINYIEIQGKNIEKFKTTTVLINLLQYNENPQEFISTINENPFLLDVIINNPSHGSKLLIKFPEYDQLSQQNIKTLYRNKSEIINQNPEINPNSFKFRQAMQEKLLSFEDNQQMLDVIKFFGVDIDKWLNYDEEKHFDLGAEGDIVFSEQIKSPIKRIDLSIAKYIEQIYGTLEEYKKDLLDKKVVSAKKTELEEKLTKMREQFVEAQKNENSAKAQGIEKGIVSTEKQISQLNPIALWDKIIGEINKLKLSGTDLSKLYEELCNLEEEQKNIRNDRKELNNHKQKINKQEDKIKEKIIDFDKSLSDFKSMLVGTLEQAFVKDRKESIIQEISMSTGEDMEHYRSDLSTIKNLFKEDSGSLEKTPMRIAIAPRNPDVDLYLGNYAPCCIRIDSEYHGAESPIADYVTDLGMHNIVIYDEQRNKPVAVAWCFIGKNNDSDDSILVIDNIEANEDYSIKFRRQLEKELGDYIQQFAEASKIDKIIQGKLNNDLVVTTLSEIDSKLGGTNRATGYYLEAERDDGYDDDDND